MEFVKCQEVSLRELNKNEAWLESLIVNDPSILGLGELLFEGRQGGRDFFTIVFNTVYDNF
ncbi:hypothetical protein [Thermovibrio sp.]